MNKISISRTSALLLLPVALLLGAIAFTGANYDNQVLTPFLSHLQDKHAKFVAHKPEDRVYLQLDKPFYAPGEDVWFSAYLRDAAAFAPSEKSEIVHVEFINPRGTVESNIMLITKDGQAAGDFHLDENAPGGIYKIRAYTQWQQNDAEVMAFEREITVQKPVLPRLKMKLDFDRKAFGPGDKVVASLDLQSNANLPLANKTFRVRSSLAGVAILNQTFTTDGTGKAKIEFSLPADLATNDGLLNVLIDYEGLTESISRSIPIVLNKIDLTFYPEGGDLVMGRESNLAFKALNEFGKPADVEGMIFDETGAVATFTTFHQGMGAVRFRPLEGKSYRAVITKPEGIKASYPLPAPVIKGLSLSKHAQTSSALEMKVSASEADEAHLVVQVRGKIYWRSGLTLDPGDNLVNVPLANLPMGVAQITLFDNRGVPVCERLAFVNRDRQLRIDVKTDKEKYLPREKVDMSIRVTDAAGMPVPALLSLSVVNDQLLSFADDKQGNILSKMMLEYDLKEKVEEPAFYFDVKEEKSLKALDYLMLTSGWRRFEWKQVTDGMMPQLSYAGELARISGIVRDESGRPLPGASVRDYATGTETLTDASGRFRFTGTAVSFPANLQVTREGYSAGWIYASGFSESYATNIYKVLQQPVATLKADSYLSSGTVVALPAGNGGAVYNWAGAPAMADNMVFNLTVDDAAGAVDGTFMVETQDELTEAEEPELKDLEAPLKEAPMPDPGQGKEKRELNRKQQEMQEKVVGILDGDEEWNEGEVMDERDLLLRAEDKNMNQAAGAVYYRARVFPEVKHEVQSGQPALEFERTDFRSTVYWNPRIEVGSDGIASLSFYNSDEITSFRTVIEGISHTGLVGRGECVHFTQMPFGLATKVPTEVATEDVIQVPVILKNNTGSLLSGRLDVKAPAGLEPVNVPAGTVSVMPGETKTLFLTYKALSKPGKDAFRISFVSQGFQDAFTQEMKITPKGFPVALAFSDSKREAEYEINLRDLVNGSLRVQFSAFPSTTSDLLKGIEGILAEPYGCFEQTSTSSYPNVLVMQYLKNDKNADPAIIARANQLLNSGYKKLTSYETPQKGYEWFGGAPAHEALTAYGLMQFNDMKGVYGGVDQSMIDRTAAWLMSRRDGKGGFLRDPQALDDFGRADNDITNAYIVYALAEAGYKDIRKEADAAFASAMGDKDPYKLALMANAMYALGDASRGNQALSALLSAQSGDGSFTGKKHSVTYSTDQSLTIETTALSCMAMMKAGTAHEASLQKAVKFLMSSRGSYGGFGSTQGTILSLKALTQYSEHSARTPEDGTIELYVDGNKVSTVNYKAGDQNEIQVKDLQNCLGEGSHKLKVKYVNVKNPLPYTLSVNYSTTLPASSRECKVKLATNLSENQVRMGETVRLSATLTNTTQDGLPMTMAILGIPAGLSAQPWQLKEMQEKGVFDFYEVIGSNVVAYYRQMKPGEVRHINLDLKAEVPGTFEAPASSAYLYYTPEFKVWCAVPAVQIAE